MIELDLTMAAEDVARYLGLASLAEQLGEVELKLQVEEITADEAGHARALRRILRGM